MGYGAEFGSIATLASAMNATMSYCLLGSLLDEQQKGKEQRESQENDDVMLYIAIYKESGRDQKQGKAAEPLLIWLISSCQELLLSASFCVIIVTASGCLSKRQQAGWKKHTHIQKTKKKKNNMNKVC